MTKVRRGFFLLGAIVLATCSQALAHDPPPSISQPGPNLPPEGVYLSPSQVHATYTGGALTVVLQAVQHQPFANQSATNYPPQCDSSAGVPGGACEHHHFNSGLEAMVSVNGSPFLPIELQGPVDTNAYGRTAPGQTGNFQTEITAMMLTGPFGTNTVRIRESPTLPSLGQTSIQPDGGGAYLIDSFFDVFTELSVNGGPWIPNSEPSTFGPNGSTHVDLYAVPEPTSIALLALALVGFAGMARRR